MQVRRMKNDHGCVSEAEGKSVVRAVCPHSQRSTDSRDGVLQLSGISISNSSGGSGVVSVNERCGECGTPSRTDSGR
jgi:hypothetical protein